MSTNNVPVQPSRQVRRHNQRRLAKYWRAVNKYEAVWGNHIGFNPPILRTPAPIPADYWTALHAWMNGRTGEIARAAKRAEFAKFYNQMLPNFNVGRYSRNYDRNVKAHLRYLFDEKGARSA